MAKIRIIKKNNDCSMEYEVGDICEVTGTWYGGVHINGRSGIPVSLDKEEYMELNTEPEEPDSAENENTSEPPEHDIHAGDIVKHFKREWVSPDTSEYLYKVLAVAHHTENGEKLMIYQALYAPFKICARPYDMFMSEVDRDKYPDREFDSWISEKSTCRSHKTCFFCVKFLVFIYCILLQCVVKYNKGGILHASYYIEI